MKHLTIRNLPDDIAEALQDRRQRSKMSLNQTVIELLGRALGVKGEGKGGNGLARLAGTWSEEEYKRFEAAVAVTEQIDEELWR